MGTTASAQTVDEVIILKPNNKMIKMNIMDMDIITATNGTDYWRNQMGQVKDMTVAAKDQFGSSFYRYSGASIAGLIGNGSFTYSGKEDIEPSIFAMPAQ